MEPTEPTPPAEPMAPAEPMTPMDAPPAEPMAAPPAPPAANWTAPSAPPAMAAMTAGRPMGLTIAAILAVVLGAFAALGAVALLLFGTIFGAASGAASGSGALGGVIAGVGIVGAIIAGLIAFAYFATALGNWRGRSWSWTLGMVVWIVTLVFGVLGLAGGISVTGLIFQVAFPVIAIYFLWQPEVKRALGRA